MKQLIQFVTVTILMTISAIILTKLIFYSVNKMEEIGILPKYKCEIGWEEKLVIQQGDSVTMCNSGELYKKRIEYYSK